MSEPSLDLQAGDMATNRDEAKRRGRVNACHRWLSTQVRGGTGYDELDPLVCL